MKIKTMQKLSQWKVACTLLAILGSMSLSYSTDPGSMEAINSASSDQRNIIGIEISTATDFQRTTIGCGEGALISAVIPGHPAASAGLEVGDIITKINGVRIRGHSEALEAMNGLDAGQSYPFEVCRVASGKVFKLTFSILVEKVQEKSIGKIS